MKKIVVRIIKIILKIFYVFPVNNKKIFLMSFDGKTYGYDQKAIVEYILKNHPNEFVLHWGTQEKNELIGGITELKLNKIKSFTGIYNLMTAGFLIYNINPPSYIPFRGNQILINTWHGALSKKGGKYIPNFDEKQFNTTTCFLSTSKAFTDIAIRDSFCYKGEILECGFPHNDIFFNPDFNDYRKCIRNKLKIAQNDKVLIYAPTFRNDFIYEDSGLEIDKLIKALEKKFSGTWKILFRMHPMIASKYKINLSYAINVSDYPDMQDLLVASDILITDYSSSMWDFCLTKKPVFIFAPDVKKYIASRGFSIPIEKWPYMIATSNEELNENIQKFNHNKYLSNLDDYFEEIGSFENGHACEEVMKYVIKKRKQKLVK